MVIPTLFPAKCNDSNGPTARAELPVHRSPGELQSLEAAAESGLPVG